MKITRSSEVFTKGKLPQTEAEWLKLEGVTSAHVLVGKQAIQYAIFDPRSHSSPEHLAIFVGGIPRHAERRAKLPVVNKLFGYVAAGLAINSTIGLSFNWPGQGKSEGNIMETSIDSRTDLLLELTNTMHRTFGTHKTSYVGASMGAYCAMLAADTLPAENIHRMAFLSPAAYPEKAHSLSYDDGFGRKISEPWVAEGSPVNKILSNTDIPTLIAHCEYDDPPIPIEIQSMYQSTAVNPNVTHEIINGVGHNFRRPESEESRNIIDNDAVRAFGRRVVAFLEEK